MLNFHRKWYHKGSMRCHSLWWCVTKGVVTNNGEGGYKTGRGGGGHVKFYPYKRCGVGGGGALVSDYT